MENISIVEAVKLYGANEIKNLMNVQKIEVEEQALEAPIYMLDVLGKWS